MVILLSLHHLENILVLTLISLCLEKMILSKVNARLKFMYRHSSSLSYLQEPEKNLCSALILCHFDYSCSSWYAGLTKCLKNKLQIAQI